MSGGKKTLTGTILGDSPRRPSTGLSTASVDDLTHPLPASSGARRHARIHAALRAISAANPRRCWIRAGRRPPQLKWFLNGLVEGPPLRH